MHAHIVLFGTSHSLQCGTKTHTPAQVNRYRMRIRQVCRSHKIAFIAEEMSSDGLSYYERETTIAARLPKKLRIQHKFVDLTTAERANLGIDDGSLAGAAMHLGDSQSARHLRDQFTSRIADPLRERCWFGRILACNAWPTLFICGANHIGNMGALIGGVGQVATVAEWDYEP